MKKYLIGLFFLLFATLASAQNDDLSGGLIFEGEPYMIIDPANPQHITVAWMGSVPLNHVAIKVKTTFNGGMSWSTPVALPHQYSTWTSADVSMAFDHSGNLYVCYIDSRQSPDSGGVYIAKSTDGGLSFGASSLVISGFADGTKYPLDRPWLTIGHVPGGSADTMYVTTKPAPWVSPPNRPYFTKSTDYGSTWSSWRYIDSTGYLVGNVIQAPMAAPAVDSAGRFHCVYPTYLASASIYPRYIMATAGAANSFSYNVAYTVIGASTIDTLSKAGHRLICDPINNRHYALLYIQNLHGDLDVFSQETLDGGVTWSSLARVNDDALSNGKMQDLVWGNFDEHGNMITAWRDRRDAPGTGYQQASEIWGAIKWKDSTSFSANFKIADSLAAYDSIYLSGNGNDFMNVAMAQDTMTAVWGDVRTGILNIWIERRSMVTGVSTGIRNLVHEQAPGCSIYPNPASNSITIAGPDISSVSLSDLNGRVVLRRDVNADKTTLDLSRLVPGDYIATIKTKSGTTSAKITRE